MGERTRALDWSNTPLGPPSTWPQSLRSAVSIMLASKTQMVLFWGPEFTVLYNDAYRPVFGAKHPTALGLPGREAWSEIWESQLRGLLQGVVDTGDAFHAENLPFLIERFGYLEETFFDVSYDPVRVESGKVGGVLCIVTETTARVVGERRLKTLRDVAARNTDALTPEDGCARSLEAFSANAADEPFGLVFLSGADGAAPMLSCSSPGTDALHDPGRWPWAALRQSGSLLVLDLDLVKEAVAVGTYGHPVRQVAVIPLTIGTQGGRWGMLVIGLNPLRPVDDEHRAFLEILGNQVAAGLARAQAYVDEKKRSEALASLDRAKTAFFSNVSHEFRTPLTLMLGPVDDALADTEHPLDPVQRERQELVRRNGRRLQKLVTTLLDFSRIEAGRAQASYAPTDLSALTADLASGFRSAIDKAGLTLTVDCLPLGEPVYVDRDMWEKIVLNLLSNAFKFTFHGGITVSLRRAGATAELAVQDSGTGIPSAELPHVFERFRRVEGVRSRTHEGTGIGLALVQELVKLHGGTVTAASTEGAGTTFTVSVPVGRSHLPADRIEAARAPAASLGAQSFVEEALHWIPGGASEPEAQPAASSERRPRIVWADDNADMREYVRRLLSSRYEVEAVADGEAALATIVAARPDLVLSDSMMPRLDGLGLVRALRADSRTADLPVILLSARAGEENRIEGLDAGADDYIHKPFSARELLARISARLELGRLQQRLAQQLRDEDRRKDEFLATLSHELRNPLAPLRNSLALLQLTGKDNPQLAPIQQMMERQVNHLVRLVDDLLEVSRISRGTFELRRERVEVASIVRNAIETSEPLIQSAGHHLTVSLPEKTLWLDGDPVRMAQILANLLNNAASYTEPGGRITVTARAQDGWVEIVVRDNGSGIVIESLPRIFEMFTRGDRPSGGRHAGLGIGLALGRRLAQMHGGTLTAQSEGPGTGSQFILRLPLAAEAGSRVADVRVGQGGLSLKRILVVDDNRDAADSLGMILRFLGADVSVARDGEEAMIQFAEYEPAVVLLDIGLPGMDGYEVARRIRSEHPDRNVALVALTGWGQEDDRRRAREAGFDHHLVKPADVEALQGLLAVLGSGLTAQAAR